MPTKTRPTKGGALSEEKQARMLQAAVDVFFAQGYRASMESIAAKAKVAKQTVYNHFGSKEKLFEAVVRQLAGGAVVALTDDDANPRAALLKFGAAVRARVLSPKGIGVYRTLVAEAPRFPKLARLIYATGPESAQNALCDFLAKHMQRGTLRKGDAQFAAQMLMSMLYSYERARLLYAIRTDLSSSSEPRRIEHIVDCFLRAFALDRINVPESVLREKSHASLH